MTDRFYGALGLAQKAGKCVSGEFAVAKAMPSGKVRLLIVDAAASVATKDRFRIDCEHHGIAYLEAEEIGSAIGKPTRMIIGVTDEGFKNMILRAAEPHNE